jgi:hypothetical protein
MGRSCVGAVLVVSLPCGLLTGAASAHPASGIVVSAAGEVFFVHTGQGVGKIDAENRLTYIHKVAGGGHFLALDAKGEFSTQLPRLFERITPAGVKPAVLYASGGAPFVVNPDGNLYYGSGFPEGDDLTPGGLTLTRLAPDKTRTLFAPGLKDTLAKMKEAITGLATGPDGTLFVAGPSAILKVKTDGTATTLVHPVEVKDGEDAFGKEANSPFYHPPYLRGLDVTEEETVYAAVTGRRCVVKVSKAGKVETVLKSEKPWSPTGVAVRGKDLFVLEYTNTDQAKDWVPRVRKLGADGKVAVLADLTRAEKTRER